MGAFRSGSVPALRNLWFDTSGLYLQVRPRLAEASFSNTAAGAHSASTTSGDRPDAAIGTPAWRPRWSGSLRPVLLLAPLRD